MAEAIVSDLQLAKEGQGGQVEAGEIDSVRAVIGDGYVGGERTEGQIIGFGADGDVHVV